MTKMINLLITNYFYKKKYTKIADNLTVHNVCKQLIKLNVIKYSVVQNKTRIIFFQTNTLGIKLKNFFKTSAKKFITINELKSVGKNKKITLIISTNKGVMTNIEAIKNNVGGVLLIGVMY